MCFAIGNKKIKVLFNCITWKPSKSLPFPKGQLEQGATQMLEQDEQVIRIDECLLWGTFEEIFRMVSQVLVERIRGCDH